MLYRKVSKWRLWSSCTVEFVYHARYKVDGTYPLCPVFGRGYHPNAPIALFSSCIESPPVISSKEFIGFPKHSGDKIAGGGGHHVTCRAPNIQKYPQTPLKNS